MWNDDEPVFKRDRWGTNRYTYNVHNPIGLALTVLTVILVVVVLVLMNKRAGPFASPNPHESRPDVREWRPPTPWSTSAPSSSPTAAPTSASATASARPSSP